MPPDKGGPVRTRLEEKGTDVNTTTFRNRVVIAGIGVGAAGLLVLGAGGAMAATGAGPWGTWGPCAPTRVGAEGTTLGQAGGGPGFMAGDDDGMSVAGLKKAMLAQMEELLAENTALTDEQRAYLLDRMDGRVSAMINADRDGNGGMMGGAGGRWN